jgi:hypothetical protein
MNSARIPFLAGMLSGAVICFFVMKHEGKRETTAGVPALSPLSLREDKMVIASVGPFWPPPKAESHQAPATEPIGLVVSDGPDKDHARQQLIAAAKGMINLAALSGVDWGEMAPLLARESPREIFELALQLPTGAISQALCVEALRALAKRDGGEAWKQLERLGPGSVEREATTAVLEAWAAADPGSAARALASLPIGDVEPHRAVARVWAEANASAALDWALAQDAAARGDALHAVIQGAVANDQGRPMEAVVAGILEGIPSDEDRASAASAVAVELANVDAGRAIQWANSLPQKDREAAISTLAQEVAKSQPLALSNAITRLTQDRAFLPADPEQFGGAVGAVARSYAETDAKAAVEWAASLPPAYAGEAIHQALGGWVRRDPATASAWIASLPSSAQSDCLRLEFASQIASLDPACALSWAQACQPGAERDEVMRVIALVQQGATPGDR